MAEKLVKEKEIGGKEEEEIPYRRPKLESDTVADGDWLNEGGYSKEKSKTWYNPTNDRRKTIEGPRVTLEYKHVIVSSSNVRHYDMLVLQELHWSTSMS